MQQLGEPIDKSLWGELEPEEGIVPSVACVSLMTITEDEEEESEGEEEDHEEVAEITPADGAQTPSGLATPSGITSVVSTVGGGLETPDFLELRKNAARVDADSGPRSLYQVVPERQTSIRGLMGSERAYDVGAVGGSGAVPVLGDDNRGTKVGLRRFLQAELTLYSGKPTALTSR